ncbi:hypothetical protein ACFY1L_22000 [Streptomyces sp. NPDC001663]|uniref:hypothetical protein n=1 Tax=Streptomyces sp. NPDC001663 TaxID=3364597 RepID=UPI0036783FB1
MNDPVAAPYADDFVLGTPLPLAPSITLDAGLAAVYQGITGDPLRLALSDVDSANTAGAGGRVVNPGLVLQVAIGQSTVATKRVIANLFYRSVALHRQVRIGDTLTTEVTPVALELTKPNPRGRRAKVLLRMRTTDQLGRVVAEFERLALLPCRDPDSVTVAGTIGTATDDTPLDDYLRFVPDWRLDSFPTAFDRLTVDSDPLSDTVSNALELVRLTQNQAAAHRDPARGIDGKRLVYGGHAIGLAQASLGRVVPGLVTLLGWRSCDHLAPVFEGDVLDFRHEELDRLAVAPGAEVIGFRVLVTVRSGEPGGGGRDSEVLDWRPVVLARTHTNASSGGTP